MNDKKLTPKTYLKQKNRNRKYNERCYSDSFVQYQFIDSVFVLQVEKGNIISVTRVTECSISNLSGMFDNTGLLW